VISKGVQELTDRVQLLLEYDSQMSKLKILKSIKPHTQARELLLKAFLLNIQAYDSCGPDFFHSFHIYIKKAWMILSNVDPPVMALYRQKNKGQKK